MGKWQKIDPDDLEPGDKFKAVRVDVGLRERVTGSVGSVGGYFLVDSTGVEWTTSIYQWYIRKPKKAKPDSELADGHSAHHWRNRYNKQLDHNKQLEASNAGRRVKMQRLEKEAKDARHSEIKWASRYAALAASINELPKKPTPPTRPDEPPVGSFFRVDRTGGKFLSIEPNGDYRYLVLDRATDDWPSDTRPWDEITEPGDTITRLSLVEATDD